MAPVMDRSGAWAGIRVRCGSDCRQLLADHLAALADAATGLRIFLDSDVFAAELAQSAPDRFVIVCRADEASSPAAGVSSIYEGRELACGVNTRAEYEAAVAGNAQWFSGKLVAHPPATAGMQDANRAVLLRLLALIAQDADSAEIEQVFKREPGLSFNLFRLVNSVSMGLSTKVSTFGQAIMVLGRRQMQRWIQLMLYTSNKNAEEASNPLLQFAAMRAKTMECLAAAFGWDASRQEHAFMAGIFSLLDSLLGPSMQEIVDIVPLPDDVAAALLRQGGELSEMLALVEKIQAGETGLALPEQLQLAPEKLACCQLDAVRWAAGMNREMA